jgi:hypothetical protein
MHTVLKGATLIDGTDRDPLTHSVLIFSETKIVDIGTGEEIMTCSGTEYFSGMYRIADGVDENRKAGERDGIPVFMVEKAERLKEMRHLALQKAVSAGVKIAIGTDAGTPIRSG